MHKQVKESLDAIMGPQPLFNEAKQRRILDELHKPSQFREKTPFFRRWNPAFGYAVLILLGGVLIFNLFSNTGWNMSGMQKSESVQDSADQPSTNPNGEESGKDFDGVYDEDKSDDKGSDDKSVSSEEKDRLLLEIAKLEDENEILKSQLETLQPWSTITESKLITLGYQGTSQDLIKEIQAQPEIIPYENSSGGTMFITDVYLLSHQHAFANFSNGHTIGYLLLKFEIIDGKAANWKVLDSYIDGEENR